MAESPELLTYEEVTRYQHQPGERPRLVVLIGRWHLQRMGGGFLPGGDGREPSWNLAAFLLFLRVSGSPTT